MDERKVFAGVRASTLAALAVAGGLLALTGCTTSGGDKQCSGEKGCPGGEKRCAPKSEQSK
jgi:hypothetical protein